TTTRKLLDPSRLSSHREFKSEVARAAWGERRRAVHRYLYLREAGPGAAGRFLSNFFQVRTRFDAKLSDPSTGAALSPSARVEAVRQDLLARDRNDNEQAPGAEEATALQVCMICSAGALAGASARAPPYTDDEVRAVLSAPKPGKRTTHGCYAALRVETPAGARLTRALMNLARAACVTAKIWSLWQITLLHKSGPNTVRALSALRPISIAMEMASAQDALWIGRNSGALEAHCGPCQQGGAGDALTLVIGLALHAQLRRAQGLHTWWALADGKCAFDAPSRHARLAGVYNAGVRGPDWLILDDVKAQNHQCLSLHGLLSPLKLDGVAQEVSRLEKAEESPWPQARPPLRGALGSLSSLADRVAPLLQSALARGRSLFDELLQAAECGGFFIPAAADQIPPRIESVIIYASPLLALAEGAEAALNRLQVELRLPSPPVQMDRHPACAAEQLEAARANPARLERHRLQVVRPALVEHDRQAEAADAWARWGVKDYFLTARISTLGAASASSCEGRRPQGQAVGAPRAPGARPVLFDGLALDVVAGGAGDQLAKFDGGAVSAALAGAARAPLTGDGPPGRAEGVGAGAASGARQGSAGRQLDVQVAGRVERNMDQPVDILDHCAPTQVDSPYQQYQRTLLESSTLCSETNTPVVARSGSGWHSKTTLTLTYRGLRGADASAALKGEAPLSVRTGGRYGIGCHFAADPLAPPAYARQTQETSAVPSAQLAGPAAAQPARLASGAGIEARPRRIPSQPATPCPFPAGPPPGDWGIFPGAAAKGRAVLPPAAAGPPELSPPRSPPTRWIGAGPESPPPPPPPPPLPPKASAADAAFTGAASPATPKAAAASPPARPLPASPGPPLLSPPPLPPGWESWRDSGSGALYFQHRSSGGHAPAVAGAAGGPTAPLVKALPPSSSPQPASSALKDYASELAALCQELEQLQVARAGWEVLVGAGAPSPHAAGPPGPPSALPLLDPVGSAAAAPDPRQFAALGSEAELREAVPGWLRKVRESFGPKPGGGRAKIAVYFASRCHSEVDLHNAATAMGVAILAGMRRGGAGKQVTAAPPFALGTGDFSQPGLDITCSNLPKQVLPIQLQNKKQGRIVMHATRPLFEEHIEELLLFFGLVTDIEGPEPKLRTQGSREAGPLIALGRQLRAFLAEEVAPPLRPARGDPPLVISPFAGPALAADAAGAVGPPLELSSQQPLRMAVLNPGWCGLLALGTDAPLDWRLQAMAQLLHDENIDICTTPGARFPPGAALPAGYPYCWLGERSASWGAVGIFLRPELLPVVRPLLDVSSARVQWFEVWTSSSGTTAASGPSLVFAAVYPAPGGDVETWSAILGELTRLRSRFPHASFLVAGDANIHLSHVLSHRPGCGCCHCHQSPEDRDIEAMLCAASLIACNPPVPAHDSGTCIDLVLADLGQQISVAVKEAVAVASDQRLLCWSMPRQCDRSAHVGFGRVSRRTDSQWDDALSAVEPLLQFAASAVELCVHAPWLRPPWSGGQASVAQRRVLLDVAAWSRDVLYTLAGHAAGVTRAVTSAASRKRRRPVGPAPADFSDHQAFKKAATQAAWDARRGAAQRFLHLRALSPGAAERFLSSFFAGQDRFEIALADPATGRVFSADEMLQAIEQDLQSGPRVVRDVACLRPISISTVMSAVVDALWTQRNRSALTQYCGAGQQGGVGDPLLVLLALLLHAQLRGAQGPPTYWALTDLRWASHDAMRLSSYLAGVVEDEWLLLDDFIQMDIQFVALQGLASEFFRLPCGTAQGALRAVASAEPDSACSRFARAVRADFNYAYGKTAAMAVAGSPDPGWVGCPVVDQKLVLGVLVDARWSLRNAAGLGRLGTRMLERAIMARARLLAQPPDHPGARMLALARRLTRASWASAVAARMAELAPPVLDIDVHPAFRHPLRGAQGSLQLRRSLLRDFKLQVVRPALQARDRAAFQRATGACLPTLGMSFAVLVPEPNQLPMSLACRVSPSLWTAVLLAELRRWTLPMLRGCPRQAAQRADLESRALLPPLSHAAMYMYQLFREGPPPEERWRHVLYVARALHDSIGSRPGT
ncbi:unnamed protein product, partial [Prorocentrum cordatum]